MDVRGDFSVRETDPERKVRGKTTARSGRPILIRMRKRQRDLIDSASAIFGEDAIGVYARHGVSRSGVGNPGPTAAAYERESV